MADVTVWDVDAVHWHLRLNTEKAQSIFPQTSNQLSDIYGEKQGREFVADAELAGLTVELL